MPTSNRKSGYVKDTFDARDNPYYYRGKLKEKADFKRANLRKKPYDPEWLLPVYDQTENSNSCVANATAAAVRFLAKKTGQTDPALCDPSRLFIYYNARAIPYLEDPTTPDGWPISVDDEDGSKTRNAMKSLTIFGTASEKSWPFVTNKGLRRVDDDDPDKILELDLVLGLNDRPSDLAYWEGKHATNMTFEYCRLDPDHTEDIEEIMSEKEKDAVGTLTLSRLKQCLVEGYPVVIGINWYFPWESTWETGTDLMKLHAKNLPDERYPWLKNLPGDIHAKPPESLEESAHALLAIGFDDDVEAVLCQNSYGDKAKDAYPYFWLPYKYIESFEASDDFWTIRFYDPAFNNALHQYGLLTTKGITPVNRWSLVAEDDDGTDVSVAPRSTYTAVCRGSKAEMWWISPHGSVEGMYNNDEKWVKHQYGGPDCGASGGIAAVSRDPSELHVFWNVQSGQRIMGARCTDADGWRLICVEANARATGKGSVAAVSRATGKMEFWWADRDGAIQGRWSEEVVHATFSNNWNGYELAPAGSATPNSAIAALSLHPGQMEVVWIAPDGAVKGKTYSDALKGWSTPIYTIAPKSSASLESPISVTGRRPGDLDVVFISASGSPQFGWCHYGNRDTITKLWIVSSLAPAYSARVDSDIKAIFVDQSFFIFWVGANNSLVMHEPHRRDDVYTLLTQPGEVKPSSPIGAFNRPNSNILSVAFTTRWETTVILEFTVR